MMRTNILTVLIILFAGNVHAGSGSVSSPNAIDISNYRFAELKGAVLIEKSRQQTVQLKRLLNHIIANKDNVDLSPRLLTLEEKYAKLILDLNSYQQNLELKVSNLPNENAAEQIQQLHTIIVQLQEESNTAKSEYQQLLTTFAAYKQDVSEIQASTIKENNANGTALQRELGLLENRLTEQIGSNGTNDILELNHAIGQQKNYLIATISMIIALVVAMFFFLKKQIVTLKADFKTDQHDFQQSLKEEGVGLDQKLVEIIETQLTIENESNTSVKIPATEEPDHSLALKVADEIVRIQKNISRMDKKTKGLKQLAASVKRIQDNFASNGYEVVEMLGQPYKEGMKVQANFIPDDELEEGQEIITRIIKPQVNFKGEMIQSAQIEVSLG